MSKEINTELVVRLRNGDEYAFEIIFKSFFEPIVNFADEYIREFEASRNIAQTVFMKLWENRISINPDLSLKSYLFTSTRNLCISHLRHLKAQVVGDLNCFSTDIFREDGFSSESAFCQTILMKFTRIILSNGLN